MMDMSEEWPGNHSSGEKHITWKQTVGRKKVIFQQRVMGFR